MKYTAYFLLLLLFTFSVRAQQPANPNAPKIQLDPEVLDYGTIDQDSDGIRTVKCTNIGKEPLIISNVQTSCGCMVADWPKEPVPPGKSCIIRIRYDTKRLGPFFKTVTMSSNAGEPVKLIKVKGMVKQPAIKDSVNIETGK